MHKYIKYILSFLFLLILHFSFANNFASVFSNEGFCVNYLGFSESGKPNSAFSEPSFKENHIFEHSNPKVVSSRSISIYGGYAELVDAWKAVGKPADLRINTRFLESISGYSDDLLNPKWADELKAAFKESPEDVTDVWKKLKEDPAASWEISKTDPKWQKWGQREFFKEATKPGKQFEDVVTSRLLNKNSDLYSKLTSKLDEVNLDISDYQIFNQVQLKYAGDDYFVGDFVMIRKEVNAVTGQVKNKAVIVEVKLNKATDLTTPQTGALNKVKGADKSLVVRSNSMNSIDEVHTLQKNLNIEVEDFVKVWSDGSGQSFSDLESLLNK